MCGKGGHEEKKQKNKKKIQKGTKERKRNNVNVRLEASSLGWRVGDYHRDVLGFAYDAGKVLEEHALFHDAVDAHLAVVATPEWERAHGRRADEAVAAIFFFAVVPRGR